MEIFSLDSDSKGGAKLTSQEYAVNSYLYRFNLYEITMLVDGYIFIS